MDNLSTYVQRHWRFIIDYDHNGISITAIAPNGFSTRSAGNTFDEAATGIIDQLENIINTGLIPE